MQRLTISILIAGICVFFITSAALANDVVQNVRAAIANHYIDEFDVSRQTDGTIVIEGNVPTFYDKLKIYEIVSKVPGVVTLSNQIVVDAPVVADKTIKSNIELEKKYVKSILEPDRIKVKIDNGIVFLDGTVSFYREKEMMETIASWQEGVKGVVNNLQVLPPKKATSDKNLKKILDQILKYEFPLQDEVSYTIDDGDVVLKGKTTSLWAKNHIPVEFVKVLGVHSVKNNLVVQTQM